MIRRWTFASLLLVGMATPAPAGAAPCARQGGTVCTAPGRQSHLSNPAGREDFHVKFAQSSTLMHVAWSDLRDSASTGSDIYLGGVSSCMDSTPVFGHVVCAEPGVQECPSVTVAGRPFSQHLPPLGFGVAVAWQDGRNGTDLDIYSRRMFSFPDSTSWDSSSLVICAATGDQSETVITRQQLGGVFIAWVDRRSGGADLYAQWVDSTGVTRWSSNGVPVCTAPGEQIGLRVLPDESGGVYFFWLDHRAEAAVYAIRLDMSGAPAPGWSIDGNRVSGAPAVPSDLFVAAGGGPGDVFVAWTDARSDAGGDVFAQHLGPGGAPEPGWPADGLMIASGTAGQAASDVAADGSGGMYAVWLEEPSAGEVDVYAQRVNGAGAVVAGWPGAGQVVCDAPGVQEDARAAASESDDGLFVVWTDHRNGEADIYGLRLLLDGSIAGGWPGWAEDGNMISSAADDQGSPVVMAGLRGALVAWIDHRDRATTGADVYGNGVSDDGQVDVPPRLAPPFELGPARPNPSAGRVTFQLQVPTGVGLEAEVLDITGRRVARLHAARGMLEWTGRTGEGVRATPSIYFLSVRALGAVNVRRFVLIR